MVDLDRFYEVVGIVRREFPDLVVDVQPSHPHVHALATIPEQAGLVASVSINLQNCDELHLNMSRFWVEWFPCGQQAVFDQFVEAVTSVLSGRLRILESYVFGSPVAARLQRPTEGGGWKTLATWSNLGVLVPWPRSHRIVQNRSGA